MTVRGEVEDKLEAKVELKLEMKIKMKLKLKLKLRPSWSWNKFKLNISFSTNFHEVKIFQYIELWAKKKTNVCNPKQPNSGAL